MESAREIGEDGCGLVIRMRGNVQNTRSDSRIFDGFDGFGQTGAGTWGRRKLRQGARCS